MSLRARGQSVGAASLASICRRRYSERGYSTRDLWTGKTKATGRDISAVVSPHGVVLYRAKTL